MENQIVEWQAQPASILTGIVGNVDPVRRVGRVLFVRGDGIAVIQPADGDAVATARVAVADLTVLGAARAGWGKPVADGGYL